MNTSISNLPWKTFWKKLSMQLTKPILYNWIVLPIPQVLIYSVLQNNIVTGPLLLKNTYIITSFLFCTLPDDLKGLFQPKWFSDFNCYCPDARILKHLAELATQKAHLPGILAYIKKNDFKIHILIPSLFTTWQFQDRSSKRVDKSELVQGESVLAKGHFSGHDQKSHKEHWNQSTTVISTTKLLMVCLQHP